MKRVVLVRFSWHILGCGLSSSVACKYCAPYSSLWWMSSMDAKQCLMRLRGAYSRDQESYGNTGSGLIMAIECLCDYQTPLLLPLPEYH